MSTNKIIPLQFANQIPGLFTIVDTQSNFIFANTISLNWFGYSSLDKVEGTSYCHFPCKVSEQHDIFTHQDKTVVNRKAPLKIFGRFCYSKNQWKILFGEKYLIRNADNEVAGIVAHFNDVTHCPIFDVSRFFSLTNNGAYKNNFNQQMSYYIEDSYPDIPLTERESECLFFVLRGKTTKEVARLLKISPRTMESHFDHIKTKLACTSKSQVIEKAIHLGYMNIIPKGLIS